MKKLFGLILLSMFVWKGAFASSSPFQKEVADALAEVNTVKHASFMFEPVADGQTATGSYLLAGPKLPANAKIVDGFIYFKNQFVDAGSGTIALFCEDANNVFTAADVTGHVSGSVIALNQNTSILNKNHFINTSIAEPCQMNAVVGGTAVTTGGTLILYIDYVVPPVAFSAS